MSRGLMRKGISPPYAHQLLELTMVTASKGSSKRYSLSRPLPKRPFRDQCQLGPPKSSTTSPLTVCTTSPIRTLLAKRPVQPHGQLAPLLFCFTADAALASDDGARDPRDVLAAAGEAGCCSQGLFANAAATGLADEGSEVCVTHGFFSFPFFFSFSCLLYGVGGLQLRRGEDTTKNKTRVGV